MSEAAGTPPLPTGLIPTALRLMAGPPPSPAQTADVSGWYEQHVAYIDDLAYRAVKAVSVAPSQRNPELLEQIGKAHDALRASAASIAGEAVPVILARDCHHTISYDNLADARAKVKVLTEELAQAQRQIDALKAREWRPAFDAMSPRQEQLAIQFCEEIAGPRGKPGRVPDPVRLLEMAEALYEAERTDFAPGERATS